MSKKSKRDKLKKSPLKKIIVSKLFLSPISYSIFNSLFDYEKVFVRWFFYKPIILLQMRYLIESREFKGLH